MGGITPELALADLGFWSGGGGEPRNYSLRFCRQSEAESCE